MRIPTYWCGDQHAPSMCSRGGEITTPIRVANPHIIISNKHTGNNTSLDSFIMTMQFQTHQKNGWINSSGHGKFCNVCWDVWTEKKHTRIAGNFGRCKFSHKINDRVAFRIKFRIFKFRMCASPNCFETWRIAAWLPCSEAYSPIAACYSGVNLALGFVTRVALLTASLASLMAAGLWDADIGPLVSGRSSTVWKYRYIYSAIVRSRSQLAGLYFTRVRIVPSLVGSVPVQNLTF